MADGTEEVRLFLDEPLRLPREQASWLLRLASLRPQTWFSAAVAFSHAQIRKDLEVLRDGVVFPADALLKASRIDPSIAGDAPILGVMVHLVAVRLRRWLDAPSETGPEWIQFGTMFRFNENGRRRSGKHGSGAAIDVNGVDFSAESRSVFAILNDLDRDWSVGIGLPFQGDMFPSSEALVAKQHDAEQAAPADATSISVTRALLKDYAWLKKAAAMRGDDGRWNWDAPINMTPLVAAATRLGDGSVRDLLLQQLQAIVFPDEPDHVHIDVRDEG